MSTARPSADRRRKSRGQILVIFVFSVVVFLGLTALVVDVAWYWANSLRMQRAADAAALAGVVHLPASPSTAISVARAEATKNGYTSGVNGYVVTPTQDPTNPRRLKVKISGPVSTYFAHVFGINSFPASRQSKAEFALPVPMGSPEQWYGVGTFEKLDRPLGQSDWRNPTTSPSGNWTSPNLGYTANNQYATRNGATNPHQAYSAFGIAPPGGATILGIEVEIEARSSDAVGCRLGVELSWSGVAVTSGTGWTVTGNVVDLTAADAVTVLGGPTDLWGRASWSATQANDTNLRVRVTYIDPGPPCTDASTASLDAVRVKFHWKEAGSNVVQAVPTPPGESVPPTSQGFWGAVFTLGGVRQNGDRYSPANFNGSGGAANPEHDPAGYDYTVELKAGASNGRVHLFDPMFCATGSNPAGTGNFGAGDHWTSRPNGAGTPNSGPVTTAYSLFDMNGTPYDLGDDSFIDSLTYTSEASDLSGDFGSPPTGGAIVDCQSNPAHNHWVTLETGLGAGMYRLNVKTSQPANASTAAENLWSIYVGADGPAGTARVYGGGRMVGYSNLNGASARQEFYLAQIDAVHAGKTLEIQLFDPGDVGGNATLRIKSPDGDSYDYVTFDYQADSNCVAGRSDACSGTNRTSFRTAVAGSGSSFDNSVVTITVPLPGSYGSGGLQPPGEAEAGWWKIEYEVGAANDTTTWQVNIRGNPVHLIVP